MSKDNGHTWTGKETADYHAGFDAGYLASRKLHHSLYEDTTIEEFEEQTLRREEKIFEKAYRNASLNVFEDIMQQMQQLKQARYTYTPSPLDDE